MFGQSLLPQDNMPKDPNKPKTLPQANKLERTGTYAGELESLRGAEATTRESHLNPKVVFAKFKDPKLKLWDKEIGANWHPLLASDFTYQEDVVAETPS